MPAKNCIKEYVAQGYYHLYNRGINKMTIFQDAQDYSMFLSYLKQYLLPKETSILQKLLTDQTTIGFQKELILQQMRLNNFYQKIKLLSYCLMPNHFHLLVRQKQEKDLESFMKSFMTRFTIYINRKYNRRGPLFEGRYRAVIVSTDEQLLYLTRYIHLNPRTVLAKGQSLQESYSSYAAYLYETNQEWIHPEEILSFFGKSQKTSYQYFVETKNTIISEKETQLLDQIELGID